MSTCQVVSSFAPVTSRPAHSTPFLPCAVSSPPSDCVPPMPLLPACAVVPVACRQSPALLASFGYRYRIMYPLDSRTSLLPGLNEPALSPTTQDTPAVDPSGWLLHGTAVMTPDTGANTTAVNLVVNTAKALYLLTDLGPQLKLSALGITVPVVSTTVQPYGTAVCRNGSNRFELSRAGLLGTSPTSRATTPCYHKDGRCTNRQNSDTVGMAGRLQGRHPPCQHQEQRPRLASIGHTVIHNSLHVPKRTGVSPDRCQHHHSGAEARIRRLSAPPGHCPGRPGQQRRRRRPYKHGHEYDNGWRWRLDG